MPEKYIYNPTRNKIGAILRTTDHIERFDLISLAIDNLLGLDEISLLHICIYMPKEESGLRKKLVEKYGREKKKIELINIDSGDFYSDLLNRAVGEQLRRGVDYSLILSAEAYEYVNRRNFNKIIDAIKNGALLVGVRLNEYAKLFEHGYVSNAFAMYRNTAANFADVWGVHGLTSDEASFGMEELYALKRILQIYGQGSVVIVSSEEGKMNYDENPDSIEWRQRTLATKLERLEKIKNMLGITKAEIGRIALI